MEGIMKKVCSICQIEKPMTEEFFIKDSTKKYGVGSRCRECNRIYDKERYQENKEIIKKRKRDNYYKNKDYYINYSKDYKKRNKKNCRDYRKEYDKDYLQRDRTKYLSFLARLRNIYKTDEDTIRNLMDKQDGRCAICGVSLPLGKNGNTNGKYYFQIDHCHHTNKIRGLLCSSCNLGIGHFKDSLRSFNRAISYIKNSLDK